MGRCDRRQNREANELAREYVGKLDADISVKRVMPAISEGSPLPRCWSPWLNQFQHFETLAEPACAG